MGICCGFAAGVAKYLLFIANAIAMMAAVVAIVIGVNMLNDLNIFAELFGRAFFPTPIVVISVGSAICLIAFFGSFGALIESRCMLITYCLLLLLALLAEAAVGTYALLQYNSIDSFMNTRVPDFFDSEYANGSTSSEYFENIQERLHCCGANGPEDFIPIFPEGSNEVPQSCCHSSPMHCTQSSAFQVGCTLELTSYVRNLFTFVGIITCSLAGVKILGLTVAMCLVSHYKKPAQQHQPVVVTEMAPHQHPQPIDLSTYQYHQPIVGYEQPGKNGSNNNAANRSSMPRY